MDSALQRQTGATQSINRVCFAIAHVLATLLLLPCKINIYPHNKFYFSRSSLVLALLRIRLNVSVIPGMRAGTATDTRSFFVFSRQVFLITTVADRSGVATRTVVCPTGTLVGFCLITPFFFTLITPFFFTLNS